MISYPQPDPLLGRKKRLWETASRGLCPGLRQRRAGKGRAGQVGARRPGWALPRTAALGAPAARPPGRLVGN